MRAGASLVAVGVFIAGPLSAQSEGPATVLATRPEPFASWSSAALPNQPPGSFPARATALADRRPRKVLIGGAVGTVAGVVFCTAVSNLVNDPGSGFSTCTLKGYFLTGGIGLAAGLLVGLIV